MLLIAKAAGRLPSAEAAAFALELADIKISSRHVRRVARQIGGELIRQRDHRAVERRRRELPARVAVAPEAVAAEVEGGRLWARGGDGGPGVHEGRNEEDKIACPVSPQSSVHERGPRPGPPEAFLQPRRARRLVQRMKGQSADAPQEGPGQEEAPAPAAQPTVRDERPGAPVKLVRACVASMADPRAFGPMVAAEAQQRGFYAAKRRAFVADAAAHDRGARRGYSPSFEPIVDLLHVLCYLYLAACAAGGDEAGRWGGYVGRLRARRRGRVAGVIGELREWQRRLDERPGEPPKGAEVEAKGPRRLVAEALRYLNNNQGRMDYPRYREAGLPMTGSLAGSLVGELNARARSRQKYWGRPEGAEAILQLRAAVLSEDGRLGRYFAQRPGHPYRRRRAA